MYTKLADRLQEDPASVRSSDIINRCVHCGFCNARCPTYLVTGNELDSPRGRIYLVKEMLEGELPPTKETANHLDRCLTCLSCQTTCPSGVDYQELIQHARAFLAREYRRPRQHEFVRSFIAKVFPQRKLFSYLVNGTRILSTPFTRAPGALGEKIRFSRQRYKTSFAPHPASPPTRTAPTVALLGGCVQPTLGADINHQTRDLIHRLGYQVVELQRSDCCGAVELHLGKEDLALKRIRRNCRNWSQQLSEAGAEHIIVNASGCGTELKNYGALLAGDNELKDVADTLSHMTLDLTEWVTQKLEHDRIGIQPSDGRLPTVVYHSACSMQHGQGIHRDVLSLLERLGFTVTEPYESHICCGSAGTYNVLQPDMARDLGLRKAKHLEASDAEVIVTGNLGCALQLQQYTDQPIIHTAELINWALSLKEAS